MVFFSFWQYIMKISTSHFKFNIHIIKLIKFEETNLRTPKHHSYDLNDFKNESV